jgi:hypothetical protein
MLGIRRLSALLLLSCICLIANSTASFSIKISSPPNANTSQSRGLNLEGGWQLLRTHNPNGSTDAVSIMHTADIAKSDLDLAGLMIRCAKPGIEVFIVLLRPFSVRVRPHVVLGQDGRETEFEARVAAPGTALLLPSNASELVTGPWMRQSELSIRVVANPAISGVVPINGLQTSFKILMTSCDER